MPPGPPMSAARERLPLGLRPALAEPAQLALPPGKERGAALELARQLLLERAGVEGGVVAEDGLLELAQLGAGLDPDLRDQRPVRVAVGLDRLGLAPGAVEGEHALRMEALVGRVLGDQRLEASEHIGVAPGGELGVDRQPDRPQVQLLEPPDLRPCEGLRGDVGERGTTPELERASGRAVDDPLLRLRPGSIDQALEARRVHGVGWQLELVAATAGDDRGPRAVGAQCLSELGDVEGKVLGGAGRRAIPPEAIDQVVHADRPIGPKREHRQDRPLLASPRGRAWPSTRASTRPRTLISSLLHCFGPPPVSPPWSCYRGLSSHRDSISSPVRGPNGAELRVPLQGGNQASLDGLADARMGRGQGPRPVVLRNARNPETARQSSRRSHRLQCGHFRGRVRAIDTLAWDEEESPDSGPAALAIA